MVTQIKFEYKDNIFHRDLIYSLPIANMKLQ